DPFARRGESPVERVRHAREGGHGLLGQTDQPLVAVPRVRRRSESGMEMERGVGVLDHLSVLVLNLFAQTHHIDRHVLHGSPSLDRPTPPVRDVSYILHATSTPEPNVMIATAQIAVDRPSQSAAAPATRAPAT